MKRALASVMCMLLAYPTGPITAAKSKRAETANELIKKSYLDLLELDQIQKFPAVEIKNVEEQLNKERDAEQARLKKDEDRIEAELKAARKRLDELNKKASRDDC
jgi:hypothetical protein